MSKKNCFQSNTKYRILNHKSKLFFLVKERFFLIEERFKSVLEEDFKSVLEEHFDIDFCL